MPGSRGIRRSCLRSVFRQASQGVLLVARDRVQALAEVIGRFRRPLPEKARRSQAVAETVFAVYIATMLEWLMREGVPQKWLMETMRERLLVLREGVA